MLKQKTIRQLHQALSDFPLKSASQTSAHRGKSAHAYNRQALEHFRSVILEIIEEVKEDLRVMNAAISDEHNGLLISRQTDFLRSLESALRRVEEGTYGRCTSCGKLIEKERLEVVPHAQLCVPCKNAGKKQAVQMAFSDQRIVAENDRR